MKKQKLWGFWMCYICFISPFYESAPSVKFAKIAKVCNFSKYLLGQLILPKFKIVKRRRVGRFTKKVKIMYKTTRLGAS